MATGTTNFPAFLQLNYDENGVNARFQSDIRSMTKSAEQVFNSSFNEISSVIDKALQPSNFSGLGKLDLGTNQFKQAAAEARLYKEAISATLRTASALATETGDTSREMQLYIQALQAQNKGARDAVQAAEAQVATYTKLQAAMDITSDKSSRLAAAQKEAFAPQTAAAAAAAQKVLASETEKLRAALDPMFAAQQRFDQELARADRLYEQGAISTREYAQAQQLARQNIRQASDAIQQQGTAFGRSAREGTNATGMVVNSLGSQRFAMIQVGQQLQDITVGFASGQRAATIFAQQLPQLGFALTGFNGKLGQLGRLLAGPVGVAIFAAVTVASFALTKAFESNEEASKGAADAIDFHLLGVKELTKAINELEEAQQKQIQTSYQAEQAAIKNAQAALNAANAKRDEAFATLELLQAELTREENLATTTASTSAEVGTRIAVASIGLREVKRQIEELTKSQVKAESALAASKVPSIMSDIEASTDKAAGATREYERALGKLQERFTSGAFGRGGDADKEFNRQATALKARRDAAIEAAREEDRLKRKRTSTSERDTRTRQQVLADFKRELESRGIDVISDYRSAAQQNALFKQGATPADGYKIPSRHQSYRAVDVDKRTFSEDAAYEAAQAAGLRGFRVLTESGGRKHLDFTGSGRPGSVDEKADKRRELEAKAAARETSRLASLSDQAAESIARINEQYDDQPRLVDRAAQSTRKLDDIISELSDPKNAGTPRLKELITEAQEARSVAANAVNTEISRYGEENDKNLEIMSLQAAGLFDQAEILQEINQLDERLGLSSNLEKQREIAIEARNILEDETATTAEREAATIALEASAVAIAKIKGQQSEISTEAKYYVEQQKELTRLTQQQTEALNDQLKVVDSIEQSLTGLLGGKVSGKEFISDLKDSFRELQAKTTFRAIFGDSFDQIRNELNKDSPLGQANARLVKEVDQTSQSASHVADSLDFVADAANAAAERLQGISNPDATGGAAIPGAANDNGIIEVKGIRDAIEIENRSVNQLADAMAAGIVGPLSGSLDEIFGTKFSQQLSGALSSALSGYIQGGEVGGVLGALKGGVFEFGPDIFGKGLTDSLLKGLDGASAGAQTGTQVAGIAKALGLGGSFSTTGSQIGGAIGSVIPIPGGQIIGSVIGGFIGGLFKKKPSGQAGVTGVDGAARISSNKSAVADSLGNLSGQLQQSIINIAEQFDAEIGAFSVSVGQREDYFRVAGSASTNTGQKNTAGFLYDGKDPEEALRIAILDALRDGAIKGIREGSQRLLQAGTDLDKAIQDALSFESVFNRLRAYKDPVGSALDALDKEFNKLIVIFGKAGASAQEYADLEELYGIERAQAIKEASDRITGSLRDLFRDLTIGDSGLSLRTRLGNAQGEYDPLAARVAAGDITAYDDYADAARTLLELQREVFGSSEEYFRLLDEVTGLTKTRIDEESNIASLAVDRDTPFTLDQTPVVNTINYQTDQLVSWLQAIAKNTGVSLGTSGVGGGGTSEPFNRNVVNF